MVKITMEFTNCNLLMEGQCSKQSPGTKKLRKLARNNLNLHLRASNKSLKFPAHEKHAYNQQRCRENHILRSSRKGCEV